MTLFNVRYKSLEAKELCSNSSSLSANKVSSQLIFRLEQAIANCLLSSSFHDWRNSCFMKPDGTAEGHSLSPACPSFGASWSSDLPGLLGNILQSLPFTFINVIAGLSPPRLKECLDESSIDCMHPFSPQSMMVSRNKACRTLEQASFLLS